MLRFQMKQRVFIVQKEDYRLPNVLNFYTPLPVREVSRRWREVI
jgi:hypothetical protein